jgi:hypothetical protein
MHLVRSVDLIHESGTKCNQGRGRRAGHQENAMALGASFYLLDTLEAPFYALETLQVCFKYIKKVKRSPKEPQGQLCFPDGPWGFECMLPNGQLISPDSPIEQNLE